MLQFLIIHKGKAFYSNVYSFENNYIQNMVVFDLANGFYCTDGNTWKQIEIDHL